MTSVVTQQQQQFCSIAEDFQPKQAAATNGTSRNRQLTTQSVLTSVALFPTRNSSCAFGTSGTFGICHYVGPNLVRVTKEEQTNFLLMYCFSSEAAWQIDNDWVLLGCIILG